MTQSHRSKAGLIAFGIFLIGASGASAQSGAPDILFALPQDSALKDPDNPTKKFRVDFARVEHEVPLSRADLMKITPENLLALSQEQVDQIYGRLTAGPIPDGMYSGTLFFARGDSLSTSGDSMETRLQEILGGLEGRLAGRSIERLEAIGGLLWKGKVFEREQRILRNMIEDTLFIRSLTDDPDTVPRRTIPRTGLLGRIFPTNTVWLLFPAKLYCGQSLLDARRESVIVDYNYSDDIEGYRQSPDSLAGRGGLRVRDEIRMVRPGFYLGRAYLNRMFLLNFTLFNSEVAEREAAGFSAGGAIAEDCWPGEQTRRAATR
jgi:hypothetical protein